MPVKILVVKISSMGDIIHAFPALRDAKAQIPDLECHWVVEESFKDIAKLNKDIDKIIDVAIRRWKHNIIGSYKDNEYKKFVHDLRHEHYDYIIDPQGLLKSAIISILAKGPTYGYDLKSIREPAASFLYKHKFKVSKSLHTITKIRHLFAKVLSYSIKDSQPSYNLDMGDCDLGFPVPKDYVVFLHGTSRENKCWQQEKWIQLAKIFAKSDIAVLLPHGNEQEYKRARVISDDCNNAICLPSCSLWQLASLIRNAKGIVGLDTGLTHLASAYDIPMVSLYGPTDSVLIGALGNNQQYKDLYTVLPQEIFTELENLIANRK